MRFPDKKYLRVSDLLVDGTPTSIADTVRENFRERRRREIIDMELLRQQQDWGYLSRQVVGAEIEPSELYPR